MNEPTVYEGSSYEQVKPGDICHACRKEFVGGDAIEFIELHNNTYYARHKRKNCHLHKFASEP
jgi:hypothetical protein